MLFFAIYRVTGVKWYSIVTWNNPKTDPIATPRPRQAQPIEHQRVSENEKNHIFGVYALHNFYANIKL